MDQKGNDAVAWEAALVAPEIVEKNHRGRNHASQRETNRDLDGRDRPGAHAAIRRGGRAHQDHLPACQRRLRDFAQTRSGRLGRVDDFAAPGARGGGEQHHDLRRRSDIALDHVGPDQGHSDDRVDERHRYGRRGARQPRVRLRTGNRRAAHRRVELSLAGHQRAWPGRQAGGRHDRSAYRQGRRLHGRLLRATHLGDRGNFLAWPRNYLRLGHRHRRRRGQRAEGEGCRGHRCTDPSRLRRGCRAGARGAWY